VNDTVAKYMDVDSSCSFCGNEDETLIHLFFQCEKTQNFWNRLYLHIGKHLDSYRPFQLNDIICYYKEDKASTSISYIFNFFLFCLGKILFTSKNYLNRSLLFHIS